MEQFGIYVESIIRAMKAGEIDKEKATQKVLFACGERFEITRKPDRIGKQFASFFDGMRASMKAIPQAWHRVGRVRYSVDGSNSFSFVVFSREYMYYIKAA